LLRLFSWRHELPHRGCSRRLQRALVDFGAEESFARAAQRVREHYGVEVSAGVVRKATYKHARVCAALPQAATPVKAARLITEMDGSMIPIVQTPDGSVPDRRKKRKVLWRESRLCLALPQGSASPVYGVTLGSARVAGELWRQTAIEAGLGPQTQVHGVGDGAPWIVEEFQTHFGMQGAYLLDFYHVSQYLAAAAPSGGQTRPWLHRQQEHLRRNRLRPVLQSLRRRLEAPAAPDQPVRAAHRYLQERRAHLDYKRALAQQLPIGSGAIESSHRHVVQKRLKIAGAWWKETNAEAMLNLRACRANSRWESSWSDTASN
jgi:hypothetical protein